MRKIFLFIFTCLCLSALAQDNQDYDEYTDSIVFVDEGLKKFIPRYTQYEEGLRVGYFWADFPAGDRHRPFHTRLSATVHTMWDKNAARQTWLISPPLDFTDFSQVFLSFNYEIWFWPAENTDTLSLNPKIDSIADCKHFEILVSTNYEGTDFAYWPPFYFPSRDDGDTIFAAKWDTVWICPVVKKGKGLEIIPLQQVVDLSPYAGQDHVRFALKLSSEKWSTERDTKRFAFPVFSIFKVIIKEKKENENSIENVKRNNSQPFSIYNSAGILIMTTDNVDKIKAKLRSGVYLVKQGYSIRKIHINN